MITPTRVIALAVCAVPALAGAQTCHPSTSSNEAKIFGSRSLAMAYGRGAPMVTDGPGAMRVGFEVAMLPHIDAAAARPTTCRPGKGPENANAVPAFGRVRFVRVFGAGFSGEAALVPPVTLAGMRPRLFSLAVGYVRPISPSLMLGARVHGTNGYIDGPITCSDRDLRDASSDCFQGTLSDDRYHPNILGAEAAIGSTFADRPLSWYGGAGYTQLTPRFQVHFVDRNGVLDSTKVEIDLKRVSLFAGATWQFAKQMRATAEVYGTPDDGATVRVLFDALLRRGR